MSTQPAAASRWHAYRSMARQLERAYRGATLCEAKAASALSDKLIDLQMTDPVARAAVPSVAWPKSINLKAPARAAGLHKLISNRRPGFFAGFAGYGTMFKT